MLSIQTNILAENANRQLGIVARNTAKVSEKLSSGYKINRAADDAAGLSISEKMRRQIRGLHQGALNIQEGIGYVQTADGALNEVHDIMQRMNELAVKAANGTNTEEDRDYIDQEIQALKEELDRVFTTTTFNDRLIWEPKEREIIGHIVTKSIEFNAAASSKNSTRITNDNYQYIAKGNYTIHADADNDKIYISWTDYGDQDHKTREISLEEFKEQGYCLKIDGFKLDDGSTYTLQFKVAEGAEPDMIYDALDGVTFSSDAHVSMHGRLETGSGAMAGSGSVRVSGITDTKGPDEVSDYIELFFEAAYESMKQNGGYTFDQANDSFLEPDKSSGSNLKKFPSADGEQWEFVFDMPGIGTVTASSSSIHYGYAKNGVWDEYTINDGTYKSFSDALNAIIANENRAGYIDLWFDIKSDGPDPIDIGRFKLRVQVRDSYPASDTWNNFQDALNNAYLDFFREGPYEETANATIGELKLGNVEEIKTPVYGGTSDFFVQAGPEAWQHIDIDYEALSVFAVGLYYTNTKTEADAANAINEIKDGLRIISEQRAVFGAYQNRLERAYNINLNSEENAQYAEAQIRDTDVAETMVQFANQNILSQAGTSMLAQANQQPNYILQLLQ